MRAQVEPLRQEIRHLTKENNQLHLDLIRAADARDDRDRRTQLAVKKYQNELADLRFMNKQQQSRVEMEQRKAESERFRLEQIMAMLGSVVGKEIDSTQYIVYSVLYAVDIY